MGIYNDIFDDAVKGSGINSRSKGCRNENMLCKEFLDKWVGEKFARTPASGGLTWKTSFASGDVVNLQRGTSFEFVVETKHYANLALTPNLRANSGIFNFWEQVQRDADKVNKLPLLAVRENGMKKGQYVIFFSFLTANKIVNVFKVPFSYRGWYKDGYYIYGFNSIELLEKVVYKDLIKEIK